MNENQLRKHKIENSENEIDVDRLVDPGEAIFQAPHAGYGVQSKTLIPNFSLFQRQTATHRIDKREYI